MSVYYININNIYYKLNKLQFNQFNLKITQDNRRCNLNLYIYLLMVYTYLCSCIMQFKYAVDNKYSYVNRGYILFVKK